MAAKILIASENSATVSRVQDALRGEAYQVIVAADGLEAVDLALDQHPNVILLGVNLAGLKGLDVARALRALDPTEHVPIIFLAQSKEQVHGAIEARLALTDSLVAPFDPAELKARCEAALRTGENIGTLRSRGSDMLLAAILDPLTRLYHRRYLLHVLAYEAARSVRYKTPLTVLMIDVDNLKEINRQYGVLTGDNALVEMAQLLRREARGADIVGRSDTQDFMILSPQTDAKGARILGDRLVQSIAEHHFIAEKLDLHLTVSIGAACSAGADLSENLALLGRAEGALDRAKRAGKNRFEVE
jgi:two-component system, cell cycle response regulator